jgi:hypothetical protein
MKVIDHLTNSKDTLFSFEILPPLKGKSIQSIFDGIDPLMEFNPKFINVTYHREEYIYKERENGLLEKIAIRKRPGTVGICAAIMNKYNVDAVPHLICGGFSKEETENALIDLQFLGIDNVLALRGDSIKTESTFRPHKDGHGFAVDLINQISEIKTASREGRIFKHFSEPGFFLGLLTIIVAMLLWNWQLLLALVVGIGMMVFTYLIPKFNWQLHWLEIRRLISSPNIRLAYSIASGGIATVITYMASAIWVDSPSPWLAAGAIIQGIGTLLTLILVPVMLLLSESIKIKYFPKRENKTTYTSL